MIAPRTSAAAARCREVIGAAPKGDAWAIAVAAGQALDDMFDHASALECENRELLGALRKAYRELNEIHARDGVPYTGDGWKSSVTQEYFTSIVEECRDAIHKAEGK